MELPPFDPKPVAHRRAEASAAHLNARGFAASATPRLGWALPAAVSHDGGYHGHLEIWHEQRLIEAVDSSEHTIDGYWDVFDLSKDDCDVLLKELLDTIADTLEKKDAILIIFEAVHLAGQAAWDAGHQPKPEVTT